MKAPKTLRNCSACRFFLPLCLLALAVVAVAQTSDDPFKKAGADARLRRAFEQTLYKLEPSGEGIFRAANPAQKLILEFNGREALIQPTNPHALRLHAHGGTPSTALCLTGFGYGDRLRTPTPATPEASGTRVDYRRDGIDEWYKNGTRGLEQGFALPSRPGRSTSGEPLIIALNVSGGLHPVLNPPGDAVLLQSGQSTILQYAGLEARDATNRAIPSHLEVRDQQIRLVVDDRNAQYPLVVDPYVTLEAELIASDGENEDYFGASVSVSGNTAIIGAPGRRGEELAEYGNEGAVYVFVLSGGTWTQQAELAPPVAAADDNFGFSVALSGNTAMVGAFSQGDHGAVYVFTQSGETWTQTAEFTGSDTTSFDEFGLSVSLNGNTALIGAPGHTVNGNANQGAAYLFTQNGTTWTQQAEFTPTDGDASDLLGSSVSLSGNTALIGAPGHTENGNTYQGAVYVFVQNEGTWSQQAELTSTDGTSDDDFGMAVSLSGDAAVIGADYKTVAGNQYQGVAYVFVRSGTSWAQQAELADPVGAADDFFGGAVALNGNTAAVGGYGETAAWVYARSGTEWSEQSELPIYSSQDRLGLSSPNTLSFGPNLFLLGAQSQNVNGNRDQGAVYVYLNVASPLTNPGFEQGASTPINATGSDVSGPSAATGWDIWNNASGTTTTELCTTTCPSGSTPPAPVDGTHTLHVITTSAYAGVYQVFAQTALTGGSLWLDIVSGSVYVSVLGSNVSGPAGDVDGFASSTGTLILPMNGLQFNEIVIYSNGAPAEFYVDAVDLVPPPLTNSAFTQGSSSQVSLTGTGNLGASAATGWNVANGVAGTTTTELCTNTCPSGATPPAPVAGSHMLHVTTTGASSGVYQTFPQTALSSGVLWLTSSAALSP